MKTDIVMVYPKTGFDVGGAISPPFSSMFAVSKLYNKGYKIRIIDQRMERNWKEIIDEEEPLCFGITVMTGVQIKFALEVAKYIKEHKSAPIVWGGSHPTILPEQTLKNKYVDIVIQGEGEEAFYNLVKSNFQKIDDNITPFNLEEQPDTPWELIDVEKYIYKSFYIRDSPRTLDIGETSRGCPNKCTFCCNCVIRRNYWRGMSAEKAIRKIRYAVKEFNLTGIWIRDDNFYVDIERVRKICLGIKDLNIKWYTAGTTIKQFNNLDDETMRILKESGCDCVKFGGESGSNRVLCMINKDQTRDDIIKSNLKCKKYDILSAYAFMIGFPSETYEEMMDTVSVMQQIKKDYPEAIIDALNMVTPHYGTQLYKQVKHLIKEPEELEDWIDYGFEGNNHQVWFDKKMRNKIQNISDMSVYMENVSRLFNSIGNPIKRIFLKTAMFLPKKYYQFRWRHNLFNYDPTLKLMRIIRKLWLKF